MDLKHEESKDIIEDLLNFDSTIEENMTERQWRILEAAIKIFSEKGFGESRTSDIAKEAEVAEGTIFRYYKTKKDLLIGLIIPLITKFFRPLIFESVEKILKNEDCKDIDKILHDLLIDRFELFEKNLPLVKTIFMEAVYHEELLETIQKNIAPKFIPVLIEFSEKNIKNGNFRDLDPNVITRTFMSLFSGYIVLNNAFPGFFKFGSLEDDVKQMIDIFLDGVRSKES